MGYLVHSKFSNLVYVSDRSWNLCRNTLHPDTTTSFWLL